MSAQKDRLFVAYDGPALQDHTMEVADLAPALLALANLIKTANYIINNGKSNISIKVNAEFIAGSF